jgi:hypothetical protein
MPVFHPYIATTGCLSGKTGLEAISVVITFSDKALREKRLEFFSDRIFHSPGNERALAEKWQKIIKSVLKP